MKNGTYNFSLGTFDPLPRRVLHCCTKVQSLTDGALFRYGRTGWDFRSIVREERAWFAAIRAPLESTGWHYTGGIMLWYIRVVWDD